MSQFCGECGANIQQPGQRSLHPVMGDESVLCGSSGRIARIYPDAAEIPPAAESPLDAAKREFAVVVEALAYHAAHEDTPVEVNTDGGWMDVTDLLEPLSKIVGE